MADLAGLAAIVMSLGMAPAIIKIRADAKLKARKLELEAGGGAETKRIVEENKLLRERVENLESIVCSVDFELNQKLARVIDDQRSLILPAGGNAGNALTAGGPAAGRDAPGSGPAGGSPALDRTATA